MITVGKVCQTENGVIEGFLNLALKCPIWDDFYKDLTIRLDLRVVACSKKCKWADYYCLSKVKGFKMPGCICVICVETVYYGKTEKVTGWQSLFYFVI